MKLFVALSCVVALALGAQDTTPPVVSLSLPQLDAGTQHRTVGDASHQYAATLDDETVAPSKSARNANRHRSVTCEVGSHADDLTECPMPTCKGYDAHQGAVPCISSYFIVNEDNKALNKDNRREEVARGLRSEWLLQYTAKDDADNYAETVSFTMIFQDTRTPKLTTEFGGEVEWDTKTSRVTTKTVTSNKISQDTFAHDLDKTWAEACYQGDCRHTLEKATITAADAYDGDVTKLIKTRLCKGPCTTESWDSARNGFTKGKWDKGYTLDTQDITTTNYWMEYKTTDKAGIFGYLETSNVATLKVEIIISDSTKPEITILAPKEITISDTDFVTNDSADSTTIECHRAGSKYVHPGAHCVDWRESWAAGKLVPKMAQHKTKHAKADTTHSSEDIGTVLFDDTSNAKANLYFTTYSCSDNADVAGKEFAQTANWADEKVRQLKVVDTTPPVIVFTGAAHIENSAGAHKHDGEDDPKKGARGGKLNSQFELDGGLNMAADGLGAQGGASCTDTCDPNPTVVAKLYSGLDCKTMIGDGSLALFDEYEAGSYSIKYTCSDQVRENQLHSSICRKIENVDHTRPIIQVLGAQRMTLEATHDGNYIDDGATCSDQVDGVISRNIEVSGDVVNLSKEDTYTIKYNCKDSAGNSAPSLTRTVVVKQTTCPQCKMTGCEKMQHNCKFTQEASFPYTDQGATCSDPIDGDLTRSIQVTNPVNVEVTGDYYVTYRVKNGAGRWNDQDDCRDHKQEYVRTVKVDDTLKPIIKVSYNSKAVAYSGNIAANKGHNGQVNGEDWKGSEGEAIRKFMSDAVSAADDTSYHAGAPFMAETTGRSGAWALGGAAAAVAGLALLGYSSRRSVTTVPV